MKALFLGLAAAAAAATLRAAPASPAPVPDAADLSSRFRLIGEDYKHASVLPPSLFNPFSIRGAGLPGLGRKDAVDSSDQAVADAVLRRRITGLSLSPDAADSRVIIGDQVFQVGDPLEFFDPDKDTPAPLVLGVRVVVRAIERESLHLEVGVEGDAPHRVDIPLRTFWRP